MRLTLLLIALTGCVGAMNKKMASWEGHHYSELVMSWGPPSQVFDDGLGGRLLVYTTRRQWTSSSQITTTTSYNGAASQTTPYDIAIWGQARSITEYLPPATYGYTAWRIFQLDATGRIVKWSWQGA